jgi:hypothetical protein
MRSPERVRLQVPLAGAPTSRAALARMVAAAQPKPTTLL